MSKKFSFIIPTIKATNLVKECIDSLKKFEPDQSQYEVLVVDDGSDDAVQNYLKDYCEQAGVKLFLKEKNMGFSHSVNTGLRNSSGEIKVLLNNDVYFIQPFLKQLEAAFARDEKIGIVGAKLLYPDGKIQHAGVTRINKTSFSHVHKFTPREFPAVNKSRYSFGVTGALFAIKKSCYQSVGSFNENYFIACEDMEYCIRAWEMGWRVFYAHDAEAIHIEGFTRGNDRSSKLKKGPEWFLKENETINKFLSDLSRFNLDSIDQQVAGLNNENKPVQELKKLEIGCGYNPQPGYLHLDVRQLPHVEYVCNYEKEKLPFKDGELDEILTNHCIEHISWRSLPFVFKEWSRVLKPGGKIFLRTPDLEFICRTYLEGKTTPEWPGDEDFVKKHLSDSITPAWWANIKLFAGQDYPSNFHFLCFDFKMLKELLERYGFTNVSRLDIQPVYSPGELQVQAFKAEAQVKNERAKNEKIVVKRRGALGDVILTTPIVRKLREDYGPEAHITVATDCGIAYANNPYVNAVIPANSSLIGDKIIDLDLCYEKNPQMHIIDAYSMHAFGNKDYDRSTDLSWTIDDERAIDNKLSESGIDPRKVTVVHMAVTWKNRTWPREYWVKALDKLVESGKTVIVIGSGSDFKYSRLGVFDWTKTITIPQIACLVSKVRCFLGNDSGLLHVAGSTDTPIVGLFTSAKGEYRLPYRNGSYGGRCITVKPTVDCYGCLHLQKPPVVFCDCSRSDYICLSQITPDIVAESVEAAYGLG